MCLKIAIPDAGLKPFFSHDKSTDGRNICRYGTLYDASFGKNRVHAPVNLLNLLSTLFESVRNRTLAPQGHPRRSPAQYNPLSQSPGPLNLQFS